LVGFSKAKALFPWLTEEKYDAIGRFSEGAVLQEGI
jgi:hypothetical protein